MYAVVKVVDKVRALLFSYSERAPPVIKGIKIPLSMLKYSCVYEIDEYQFPGTLQ